MGGSIEQEMWQLYFAEQEMGSECFSPFQIITASGEP